MSQKSASSQAAWALLTEGVASARVEAHRLKHLINRGLKLVENSGHRGHLYQVAGDLITALPKRLERLETDLDRTSLALAKMGESFLESRLPLADKTEVDEAVEPAFGGGQMRFAVDRVAVRWMQANGRISPKIKREFATRAKRLGLDGNGRFRSIGQAMNAIHKALNDDYDLGGVTVSMELDDVPSADLFMGQQGTRQLHLAYRTEDPFSPRPIVNSLLVVSWHYFEERDNYEVLAYLS